MRGRVTFHILSFSFLRVTNIRDLSNLISQVNSSFLREVPEKMSAKEGREINFNIRFNRFPIMNSSNSTRVPANVRLRTIQIVVLMKVAISTLYPFSIQVRRIPVGSVLIGIDRVALISTRILMNCVQKASRTMKGP